MAATRSWLRRIRSSGGREPYRAPEPERQKQSDNQPYTWGRFCRRVNCRSRSSCRAGLAQQHHPSRCNPALIKVIGRSPSERVGVVHALVEKVIEGPLRPARPQVFADAGYAPKELVAEVGTAVLCGGQGVGHWMGITMAGCANPRPSPARNFPK